MLGKIFTKLRDIKKEKEFSKISLALTEIKGVVKNGISKNLLIPYPRLKREYEFFDPFFHEFSSI